MYTGTALEVVALDAVTGRRVLEALAPARSEGVLQRLRGQQRDGDRRRHAVLGHGRLPPARDRREERPRDLGQGPGRLQEGLPVQRAAARRQGHGHPRTGDQRGGRQLLGGGVRHQDRQGALAIRHRAELRGCARSEDLDRRLVEARRQSDLERRQLRSGNEPDVLGNRQSEPGLERRHSHAGRQPVFRLASSRSTPTPEN